MPDKIKYPSLCTLKRKSFRHLAIFILFILPYAVIAQIPETTVVGQVVNKDDKSPVSSVNIHFKNTNTGTITNNEGYFILRSYETENILVFSSVGYKTKEIKVNLNQPTYLDVELVEQNTWLMDVFATPGANPALEWMKKIRLMRNANDISDFVDYHAEGVEQDLILLSRAEEQAINKKLYQNLNAGNLSGSDSALLVPLYMAEKKYDITSKGKKETSKTIFNSPETADRAVLQLLEGINTELNFYDNSVILFGKGFISPLSSIGNTYYNFYLTDSIVENGVKQYEIRFISKNQKNLAFNGKFTFDSLSLALTSIEAELPEKANLNFINNLVIKQKFSLLTDNKWALEKEEIQLGMTYYLGPTDPQFLPEIFISKSNDIQLTDSIELFKSFAKTEYSLITLEEKMYEMNNTPLMRTAMWIADAALTAYARVGFIDIGKIPLIIRLTDVEGFRVNAPLRTNERLWKNVSIGGYVGYGFKNKEVKYSAFGQFKLPTEKKRMFEISYLDDYRRIAYDYNDYISRQSPWNTGDDEAVNTIFSLSIGQRLSPRKEWSFGYFNDWNNDIESRAYVRLNKIYGNEDLPLFKDGNLLSHIEQQSLSLVTRFSFGEKKYEDHLNRIYIRNRKPVLYFTMEGGKTIVDNETNYYGKLLGALQQNVTTPIGQYNYLVEAGWTFGSMPYPLLEMISRNNPGGISFYIYHMMNYLEFAADKYVRFYNEFVFNGIIFNHIPLINKLNFREVIALKGAVGTLDRERHQKVLDFPNREDDRYEYYLHNLNNPYLEVSVGITNILNVFRVQFNYRITNQKADVNPWRFSAGFNFGF